MELTYFIGERNMSMKATVLQVIICFIFLGFHSTLGADVVTVTEEKSYISMTTSSLTVLINKNPWQISVHDKKNNVLLNSQTTEK